ncbi:MULTISPECIES: DoxX family protein [unclassified Sphingobacterium]|mgnify:CR=1 FL=1|uniref:DoxX family protein n=1 Tax=unclassified Sphingobacterium TaxID=2609468 RepID=UPI00265CCD6E|nr:MULTISPECIES: DoxX family protein [unclassified Sphingobacterium]WKK59017.1 DoxX family protein [Sphingobacterium sp. BN32]
MRNSKTDIGLLIIRVVIGTTMIAFHGIPKLMGGVEGWTKIGQSMQAIGINFLPTVWGFSAGFTETVGSFLLILGLWTRPASSLLAFTMLIAAIMHLSKGDGLSGASHAIEFLAVYVAFAIMGPGRLSVDKK